MVCLPALQLNTDWREKLTELVKEIQHLGSRRNRYIHDEWHFPEKGPTRVQWGGYLHKEPFKDYELRYARAHADDIPAIDALTSDIDRAIEMLTLAVLAISDGKLLGQPPTPFWQ